MMSLQKGIAIPHLTQTLDPFDTSPADRDLHMTTWQDYF